MCPRPMCPRLKILGCCAPGTKRPLYIVSLTDVSRPWTASRMELAPSAAIAASVKPPAPNGSVVRLAGFAYAPDQVYWIGAPPSDARWPTHRIKSKGWDGSVRGKISKGHFIQGMQHPRIFGRGHISRGWTNIAPF
jgi:hypothetical protein